MANTYRETRHTVASDPDRAVDTDYGMNVAARVVSVIGGIIVTVLGLRFVLVLLGANANNAFVNFIYDLSRPFVSPFFGMFNYQPQIGVVRFEFETLIAIAFWAFMTWLVIRLVTLGSRNPNL